MTTRMRLLGAVAAFLAAGTWAYAQTTPPTTTTPAATVQGPPPAPVAVGQPVAAQIGVDTAQQALKAVAVSNFSDAGMWIGSMPLDEGLIELRGLVGRPAGVKPLPDEVKLGIAGANNTVLGGKVTFFRRGFNRFSILAYRPLPVEGVVKTVSVWVVGRNTNNVLKLVVEDQDGHVADLSFGPLNFMGWKELTVAIPPSLVQTNYRRSFISGINILGFVVDCNPLEDYGSYYIYFADMRAVTDLFGLQQRATDDMSDNW